jgi:hypothetical protein
VLPWLNQLKRTCNDDDLTLPGKGWDGRQQKESEITEKGKKKKKQPVFLIMNVIFLKKIILLLLYIFCVFKLLF